MTPTIVLFFMGIIIIISVIVAKRKLLLPELITVVLTSTLGFLIALVAKSPISMGLAQMGLLIGLVFGLAIVTIAHVFRRKNS